MIETTRQDKLTVSASVLVLLGIVAWQLAAVALGQGLESFRLFQSSHVTIKKMFTFGFFHFLQHFISTFNTITLVDGKNTGPNFFARNNLLPTPYCLLYLL